MVSQFINIFPNKTASEPQLAQSLANQVQVAPDVIATLGQGASASEKKENPLDKNKIPNAAELINKSYELSGLIATLDNQDNNQARKGRKRQVSASIHRSSDALYLDSWRRKIEQIGNLNYPEKAKQEKIFGNLILKVAVNRDGTIHELKITESSGKKLLDDAALRIVRLAAPFPPLTKEMTKDTDILEIIRVWRFQPDHRLKTN